MRLGFALYDEKQYGDALVAFERMYAVVVDREGSDEDRAVALLWQGHMLDLLGRREGALARYARVVEMGVQDSWQHSQYGLGYEITPRDGSGSRARLSAWRTAIRTSLAKPAPLRGARRCASTRRPSRRGPGRRRHPGRSAPWSSVSRP